MKIIKTLYLLCCVWFATNISAQQSSEEKIKYEKSIRYAVNVGFHASNMIGENIAKEASLSLEKTDNYSYVASEVGGKFLFGYKFGYGVTFDKTKNFAWGIDLNLETKGFRVLITQIYVTNNHEYEETYSPSNLYSKTRLSYIVVPFRFEFKYKNFYVMPGVYTGVLVHGVNRAQFDYDGARISNSHSVSSWYSRLDLGAFLNVGFCYEVSDWSFIKIGCVGEWNLTGTDKLFVRGGKYNYFCNQVFGLEIKYELKI